MTEPNMNSPLDIARLMFKHPRMVNESTLVAVNSESLANETSVILNGTAGDVWVVSVTKNPYDLSGGQYAHIMWCVTTATMYSMCHARNRTHLDVVPTFTHYPRKDRNDEVPAATATLDYAGCVTYWL